tara:strand:+ start:335 stop:817 length:483 start_codon:yes stop_codon:yes gene_type:complete
MNYFYAPNGVLIKKNLIENLEIEEEESISNNLSLVDYLNKIQILTDELNDIKNNYQNLNDKFDILPKDYNGKNLKFITGDSSNWILENNTVFIDITYDLDSFSPNIYVQMIENNFISEKYLYSVIKTPENKSFRVIVHISIDNKLEFAKDNLSLNYLVIG